MVDTENLATIIETGTLKSKTSSHAISLAKVIINSHTTERGINHIMAAKRENLVTRTDHIRMMMVVGDLAAIPVKRQREILATSAVKKDTGREGVVTSQK